MKIGIVGRQETIALLRKYLNTENSLIEYDDYPCEDSTLQQTLEIAQPRADALFFTGKAQLAKAGSLMQATIPWECVRRTPTAIVMTLLKVFVECGSLDRISFNLADYSENRMALIIGDLIGCEPRDVKVFRHESYGAIDDIDSAIKFHIDNLASGKATYCLSGTSRVVTAVRNAGFRAYWVAPVAEEVQHSINKLVLEHHMMMGRMNSDVEKPVVVSIKVDHKSLDEELSLTFDSIRVDYVVKRLIGNYAQECGASVEVSHSGVFNLYMMKTEMMLSTENLTRFDLIHQLKTLGDIVSVSVGIGIGNTVAIAKSNAVSCRKSAQEKGCDYFVKEDLSQMQGPYMADMVENDTLPRNSNDKLKKISEETGVVLSNIRAISDAVEKNLIETITPGELATLTGLSINNMNRVLSSLEKKGYVQVVGSQPADGRGRPKRVVKILI